jgi:hypothetical protein
MKTIVELDIPVGCMAGVNIPAQARVVGAFPRQPPLGPLEIALVVILDPDEAVDAPRYFATVEDGGFVYEEAVFVASIEGFIPSIKGYIASLHVFEYPSYHTKAGFRYDAEMLGHSQLSMYEKVASRVFTIDGGDHAHRPQDRS